MRIVQTVPSRPMYYDRSPVNVSFRYDGANITPHSITKRGEYIVPTGKNAMFELLMVSWRRQTMASNPDMIWLLVAYTPNGGNGMYLYSKRFVSNSTSSSIDDVITNLGVLQTGDKIEFYTEDLSTGGTCAYHFDAKIFEFIK